MKLTMLFSTPEELIAQIKTLPASPQIMQRMLLLLDDSNSTVEDLVAVIQLERSLAARVVHLANSPIYNGGSCGSIEEAVQRLGYAAVHEAVMTIMAIETFPKSLRTYGARAGAPDRRGCQPRLHTRLAAQRRHGGDRFLGATKAAGRLVELRELAR